MKLIMYLILLWPIVLNADTVDHYMNIANQIPQMEVKADQQAQIWARSARHVLVITNETIAETLTEANELAKKQGQPLFCLPSGVKLDAEAIRQLIENTYKTIPGQEADKNKLTISQIAWIGILKSYPCQSKNAGLLPQL